MILCVCACACACGRSAGRHDREGNRVEDIREGGGTREVSRCGGRGESEEDKTGQYVHGQCVCVYVAKKDALVELGYGFSFTFKDWKKRSVVKLKHPRIQLLGGGNVVCVFLEGTPCFFSLYFRFFVAESYRGPFFILRWGGEASSSFHFDVETWKDAGVFHFFLHFVVGIRTS